MFGERISVGGKNYLLGPYLASGLIGTVFPAWDELDSSNTIVKAVKVPAPNLTENLHRNFWKEFETLGKLKDKWNLLNQGMPSPFPSVEKGQKADGTEVLVMEFVPDDLILSRVINNSENSFEKETKYLQAAKYYVQMLDTLHQAGYACPDRKTPDVRWSEKEHRLIVLDWNVVTENPALENIQQDFYLFGSMWHQFLTGKYAASDLDLIDDEYWGDISIGTRIIVKRLLTRHYSDVEQISSDVDSLLRWRNKDATMLSTDARKMEQEIREIEQILIRTLENKSDKTTVSWKFDNKDLDTLTLIDLAWQIGGTSYQKDRDEIIQFVRDRPKRITYYAQVALLRGNYADGLVSTNRLREWMQTQDTDLLLSLERWRVLLLTAATKPQSFREAGIVFSDWLLKFDELKSHGQPVEFWQHQEESFPLSQLSENPNLEIFLKELKIRRAWAYFHLLIGADDYSNDQYNQAQSVLESVQKLLGEIRTSDMEYAQAIQKSVLSDLDKYIKDVQKRVSVEAGISLPRIIAQHGEVKFHDYIRYRMMDTHIDDEWKKRLESVLYDLDDLDERLQQKVKENEAAHIVSTIAGLLVNDEIWSALGKDFQRTLLSLLRQPPFPPNQEGFDARLDAIEHLSSKREKIPDYLLQEIKNIQVLYLASAFEVAEHLMMQDIPFDMSRALKMYETLDVKE